MLEVELLATAGGGLHARGSVVDLRKMGFVPLINDIQNAGFVHHMKLDWEIDPVTRRVDHITVDQPYVAVEPSEGSEYECCRDPADRLLALEGEALTPGFEKHVTPLFGGALGCSHLMTLAQTMGRALPYALERDAAQRESLGNVREPRERVFKRTVFVDGLAAAETNDMELVVQLCDLTTHPRVASEVPGRRLEQQHEVQAQATVSMAGGMKLTELMCFERLRHFEDIERPTWATWSDRTDEMAELVDHPVMPGFGGRLLSNFGNRPERRAVLDALLHLGPGFLQCVAALSDGSFPGTQSRSTGGIAASTLGGNTDACYMWRTGGLAETRRQEMIRSHEADAASRAEQEKT